MCANLGCGIIWEAAFPMANVSWYLLEKKKKQNIFYGPALLRRCVITGGIQQCGLGLLFLPPLFIFLQSQ